MAELEMLLEQEIPAGRTALLESHKNLQKVAGYCAQHYIEDPNKKAALEETKNYTTQSLASVAYQINTLASNMLHMLDIQASQLANMDSAINNISQTVDIHKEKVARREIGLLTTNKVITRSHQIVAPANPDRPVKYVRKPISYDELDDIGHGIKLSSQPGGGTVRRPSAASAKKTSIDAGSNRDSVKSNLSAGYGTLRAVKAPTVPQEYSQSRRLPSMFRNRTTSNSSSGSGSRSSSIGYIPPTGAPGNVPPPPPSANVPPPPANVPPPPANIPPPPANVPPPPAMMQSPHIPPPPLMMSPQTGPPPPPAPPVLPPSASTSPESSGGYSTPNIAFDGRAPTVGGTADNYAATSVMDLPPPPPVDIMNPRDPYGAPVNRNPSLPTTGFASRFGGGSFDTGGPPGIPPPPPQMGGGMDVLPPPPPMDIPAPFDDPMSSEPSWAPKSYLAKMVVIYDYSADNPDELNLKEDQVVYVVRMNDDGWYEGVLDGVTGLFPGNYAEAVST